MKRPSSVLFLLSLAMVFSLPVLALTGADVSPVTALETVSPTVQSATALTERSLSVSFSEPLLSPGATTPGNYAVSGAGRGTLSPSPDTVTGSGPYTLTWTGGEMRDGAAVTVMVAGVQDAVGNPLLTAGATASAAGIGTVPVFSALSVTPSSASVGDTVTITFTASEPLDGDPAVTVNGHPAVWVSGAKAVDFTYTYEVAEEDAPGMAAVSVSGYDLAGNMGSLESLTALEINEAEAGLPVRAWPLALLLGGAGAVLFLRARRRGVFGGRAFRLIALFVLPALLCATAFAAPPAVSNVSMVQQDNGAGGTEAVITYDLDAPNGPCDITVSLSKDGGVDGYVFPATSVTGDVSGVAGGAGKQIVWDLRADYPEEALANARIRVTADDGLVQHTLTYTAGANGSITGDSPQVVNHGADGTAVTAVADVGYYFTQWSDGVLTATRQDLAVTADVTVTAEFAINTYTLTYTAGANGSITGDSPQTVNHGADGTAVTAVPDVNYHFTQWTDGVLTATRQDTAVTGDVTVTAEFAINAYTLTYTAGTNGTVTGDSPQTVNHGADGTAVTAVADVGYHFTQWSDGVLTATRQDTAVVGDVTVTAAFAIDTHTLTYTAGANGTITGDSPQTVNHGADGTAVTAVPDVNYHFTQWSDGVLTATRQDLAVGADITVTAEFAINTYTLTYTAGANGWITGVSPQTVNHGADGTLVTAVPGGGYAFSQWSDGVLTAARTDTNVTADLTVTATFVVPVPVVTAFAVNSGAATTMPLGVTLDNTATESPVEYMASESAAFTGAVWQAYGMAPAFTLSFGVGTRTVYFKVRSATLVESGAVSDTIFLVPNTVPVAAGAFPMGRTSAGDDATYGGTAELPVHSVTLGAYSLGKFEVTNKEYCDVLNWALAQGYLYSDTVGTPWAGSGNIYVGGAGFRFSIVSFASASCNIQYLGGVFTSKTRVGLPGTTNYSMDTHPMVMVSWYGSVAYCNLMSLWQGLTPCYDLGAANWPLTVAPPTAGGYRLPTEAEWERAAAWDGTKHWIYGFLSDTNATGTRNRCNDYNSGTYDNPLGLTATPYTSPVGWFNGTHVSPNGSVTTVNSPSPVGAYDMSGNVWEWCGDWYLGTYYGVSPASNPMGPATGTNRMLRGGSYGSVFNGCRSAGRTGLGPINMYADSGFRVSRTPVAPSPVVTAFAVNSGAATTTSPVVTLNNTAANSPTEYMASESPTFSGASWQAYGTAPSFSLSAGTGGVKTVYFKVRNAGGESNVVSDTIELVERTILLPGSVPLVLRWVPSGSYQMGRYAGEVDSNASQDPQHLVTLAYGFWMGKYEVTQQQWIAVRSTWPGTAPSAAYGLGNTYPAYYISWDDTKNFITSLNTHIAGSGQGPLTVRLPSESEWEYACRGGTQTRFYWGDDIGYAQIGAYAWYTGNNSPSGTKVRGGKTGNAFGLYDMSGNVWEWCEDDDHGNYIGAPADGSAWINSPRATNRMFRGGYWIGTAWSCRSAHRNVTPPNTRANDVGFRLAAVQ